jgi:hypothetical protein
VLVYTGALALSTGIVFGLVPALRATRPDLGSALKQGNRGAGGLSRSRPAKVLVIAQVGVSMSLLLTAGLFVRTARNLEGVDVGFNLDPSPPCHPRRSDDGVALRMTPEPATDRP